LVESSHGVTIKADLLFEEISNFSDVDLLMLPGGMPGSKNLNEHDGVRKALKEQFESGKRVAAICAAPLVLASVGLLKGKKATIYPGMESYLGEDAEYTGALVQEDGNVTTGAGPAASFPYGYHLLSYFLPAEKVEEIKKGMIYDRLSEVIDTDDDLAVGDTVLDVTKASCMRNLPFRKRHGFQIKVEGAEKRWWNMYITSVDAPDPLPDWTDYIEALEFGIDSSKYANAALVIVPKVEETKNAQGVYDGYREVGKFIYDSPTYYEPGYVADWNRVEKKIEYQLDGKDYKEAMAMLQYAADVWSQIGTPNDTGMAKKLVREQSSVQTVATTPATISKDLKYGRDYRLGTMFQWTPYAGAGILNTAWYNASTSFEALVTEYSWTIDDSGVVETPGITM